MLQIDRSSCCSAAARLEAELLVQCTPGLAQHVQCLDRPAGAIERECEVASERLTMRVLGHQRLQLADQLGVPATLQVGLDPPFEGGCSHLLQPHRLGHQHALAGDVVQSSAAPQRQRRAVGGGRLVRHPVSQRLAPSAVSRSNWSRSRDPEGPPVGRRRLWSRSHRAPGFAAGRRCVPGSHWPRWRAGVLPTPRRSPVRRTRYLLAATDSTASTALHRSPPSGSGCPSSATSSRPSSRYSRIAQIIRVRESVRKITNAVNNGARHRLFTAEPLVSAGGHAGCRGGGHPGGGLGLGGGGRTELQLALVGGDHLVTVDGVIEQQQTRSRRQTRRSTRSPDGRTVRAGMHPVLAS